MSFIPALVSIVIPRAVQIRASKLGYWNEPEKCSICGIDKPTLSNAAPEFEALGVEKIVLIAHMSAHITSIGLGGRIEVNYNKKSCYSCFYAHGTDMLGEEQIGKKIKLYGDIDSKHWNTQQIIWASPKLEKNLKDSGKYDLIMNAFEWLPKYPGDTSNYDEFCTIAADNLTAEELQEAIAISDKKRDEIRATKKVHDMYGMVPMLID